MLMDYIFNATVLLLCVFLYFLYVFHLQVRSGVRKEPHPYLTGLVFGLAGILLMLDALIVEGSVRMDLRGLAVMMAALLGGMPAAWISAVIISVGRLWLGGGLQFAPVVGALSTFIIAAGASKLIAPAPAGRRGYYWAVAFMISVTSLVYMIVVRDAHTLVKLLALYYLTVLPTAWLCLQLQVMLARIYGLYEQLHFREETYRQLFHSAQDAVYLIELESVLKPTRFLDVNDALCQLLGYSRDELLELDPLKLYDPLLLKRLPEIGDEYEMKGGRHTFEWTLCAKDGSLLPVEISGRIFNLRGQLVWLSFARDISLRKEGELKLLEANKVLEKLSVSDGLTGIANRRGFDAFYRITWDRMMLHDEPLSLLLLDIDCFKAYNDTYGHMLGDICLKRVAGALEHAAVRFGGMAARYGGEEFVVVLPGIGRDKALEYGEAIRYAIEELAVPHEASTAANRVTVSVGSATAYPARDKIGQNGLLEAADRTLYLAKHSGRNRVRVWEEEIG